MLLLLHEPNPGLKRLHLAFNTRLAVLICGGGMLSRRLLLQLILIVVIEIEHPLFIISIHL